jgi:hypothetical protein
MAPGPADALIQAAVPLDGPYPSPASKDSNATELKYFPAAEPDVLLSA